MDNKVKNIVKSAYTEVPLYIKSICNCGQSIDDILKNDAFEKIPFIDKSEIINNGNNVISAGYVPMYLSKELMIERTSGSSGQYMEIYWDKKDFTKSMMQLWLLRKKYYGILPTDKMCYFFTVYKEMVEDEQDEHLEKNVWGFSKINLSTSRIIEIYKKMCEFKPKWLMLQPSIAVLLCQCIKNYSLEKLDCVEYIEFSGEILTDEVRKMTKEIFNCQIADQYGANELNSIAYECPCGNMHVMDSNVYVEIIDETGKNVKNQCGEICVTTLTNNAMPLIRYKIGDIGMITDKNCTCGNTAPVMSLMSGRKNDFVLCEDRTQITAYSFVKAIDIVNLKINGAIKQFNIIQKDINMFKVKFVVDFDEIFDTYQLEDLFINSIVEDRLYNAEFEFEYEEKLFPENRTGKFSYFKRELDSE